jgi:hypothetical protein
MVSNQEGDVVFNIEAHNFADENGVLCTDDGKFNGGAIQDRIENDGFAASRRCQRRAQGGLARFRDCRIKQAVDHDGGLGRHQTQCRCKEYCGNRLFLRFHQFTPPVLFPVVRESALRMKSALEVGILVGIRAMRRKQCENILQSFELCLYG